MKNRFHIQESKNALYWLCLLLGMIVIGMMVAKFFSPGFAIPSQFIMAYPIILAAYVAVKEVIRWTGVKYATQIGELFVILWWGTFILMGVTQFILYNMLGLDKERFVIPGEMLGICIEVVVIFSCSEISKKLHLSKNNKGDGSEAKDKKAKS